MSAGQPRDDAPGAAPAAPATAPAAAPASGASRDDAPVPGVPPGPWRALLLAAVAACAACGLIYELALLALAASLGRGDVVATSVIVAGYVAALGLGALAAKPLVARAASSFLLVEATLGLIGGLSASALYAVFAITGDALAPLTLSTLLIGVLVGAEVPLLMTLLQRGVSASAEDSGRVLANLNAADYLGALLGGLAWPFLLLPQLGLLRATAATGLVNVAAALFIGVVLLRGIAGRRALLAAVAMLLVAATALTALLVKARDVEVTVRQRLYAAPVVHAEASRYQDIVVTRDGADRRLYLDGGLQYSTRDEHRYTESLVFPAVTPETRTALVLGGGDGLAARDLLTVPGMERIVQVELDPAVIELARTELREDNGGSLDDPRVTVRVDDAFAWLREAAPGAGDVPAGGFDAVYVDLPDPDSAVLARLYSEEMYGMIRKVTAPHGRLVVQSGSPFSTPDAYWRTVNTVEAAGWGVTPYHVHVPTFGDWGFTLAARDGVPVPVEYPRFAGGDPGPEMRFLTPAIAEASMAFGADDARRDLEPTTLAHPRIVDDLRRGYRQAGQ
ncbi:polyamine aminopropyltransferase [Corynebacterium sp. 335C]